MEVDMTNFLKLSVAPVAFMMMSTAAFALTPVGEVYTPDGASENAPYWQDSKLSQATVTGRMRLGFSKKPISPMSSSGGR